MNTHFAADERLHRDVVSSSIIHASSPPLLIHSEVNPNPGARNALFQIARLAKYLC